ncbi:MAG: tRNA (adenosine(37)-N6)-threonylcarbamoyltransferase complex ATPase subunit type 1 TsaE [Gemmatimonadota bacterium]
MSEGKADVLDAVVDQATLEAWAAEVGRLAHRPLTVCLHGPLGAGKSVVARAVARGAGVRGAMPSPTFNLRFSYRLPGGGYLLHIDLYRLSPSEIWDVGWEDVGAAGIVALVEWAERARRLLPEDRWDVRLSPVQGLAARRRLEVRRLGDAPPIPSLPVAERHAAGSGASGGA